MLPPAALNSGREDPGDRHHADEERRERPLALWRAAEEERRQVPEGPQHRQDQVGADRAELALQQRQGHAAPPELLHRAECQHQQQRRDHGEPGVEGEGERAALQPCPEVEGGGDAQQQVERPPAAAPAIGSAAAGSCAGPRRRSGAAPGRCRRWPGRRRRRRTAGWSGRAGRRSARAARRTGSRSRPAPRTGRTPWRRTGWRSERSSAFGQSVWWSLRTFLSL